VTGATTADEETNMNQRKVLIRLALAIMLALIALVAIRLHGAAAAL
jgi:hypothetical protein